MTVALVAASSAQPAPADASPPADEATHLGLLLFVGLGLAVLGIALAVFARRARAADRQAPASSPATLGVEPIPAGSSTGSSRLGRVLSLRSSDVALEDVTGATTEAAQENIDRILERVVERAEEQQAMPKPTWSGCWRSSWKWPTTDSPLPTRTSIAWSGASCSRPRSDRGS